MLHRLAKAVLLVSLALLSSCVTVEQPPDHDCLQDYWGAQVAELLPGLHEQRILNGPGWAANLDDQETYDALLALKVDLEDAVGWQPGSPRPRGSGVTQTPELIRLKELAISLRERLDWDRTSGYHEIPDKPGWLPRGGTDRAVWTVSDAPCGLLPVLKDALDM